MRSEQTEIGVRSGSHINEIGQNTENSPEYLTSKFFIKVKEGIEKVNKL